MKTEIIRDAAGLASLRSEWESLEQADPTVPYYSTHRFVTAWWDSYQHADDHRLLVITARQDGRLVGVAPLSYRPQKRHGQPIYEVRFASHGDYLSFVLTPGPAAVRVAGVLLDRLHEEGDWDILNLTNIPAGSPLAAHILRSDHNKQLTYLTENPVLDLRPFADFSDFTSHRLPSHTRKYRNRLLRETGATFEVHVGNKDGIFDRIAQLHRQQRDFLVAEKDRKERHSLYDDAFRVAHYRQIFDLPADTVTFTYEDDDHQLLGYRTCFSYRRTLLSWNSAYHPSAAHLRMGKVIQYDILDWMFRSGEADVFDFGAGRYPWKFEWTDTAPLTYRFRIDRPALPPTAPPPQLRTSPDAAPPEEPHRTGSRAPETEAQGATSATASSRQLQLLRAAPLAAVRRTTIRAARVVRRATRPPVIWYVPHPDDETIFMGGSIWQTLDRRRVVVALTQGGSSVVRRWLNDRLGQRLSQSDLERSRMGELGRAVAHLGVRPEDLHIQDLPDGALTVALVRTVVEQMEARYPGASHRAMSYLDPHPDHAASGRAVLEAFREGVIKDCLFHVPVHQVTTSVGSRVSLTRPAASAKRAALAEYRIWDPDGERYAIGALSVPDLIRRQAADPEEWVHGPEIDSL